MTITEKYHACIMVELSTPFELQRLRDTEDGVVSGLLINKVLTPNQRALAETTWFLADQNLATPNPIVIKEGQYEVSLKITSEIKIIAERTHTISKRIKVEVEVQKPEAERRPNRAIIDLFQHSNLSARQKLVSIVITCCTFKTIFTRPVNLADGENHLTVAITPWNYDGNDHSWFDLVAMVPLIILGVGLLLVLPTVEKKGTSEDQNTELEDIAQTVIDNLRVEGEIRKKADNLIDLLGQQRESLEQTAQAFSSGKEELVQTKESVEVLREQQSVILKEQKALKQQNADVAQYAARIKVLMGLVEGKNEKTGRVKKLFQGALLQERTPEEYQRILNNALRILEGEL